MRTLIYNITYRNESYAIVKDGKFYMSINHKFIDDKGNTNKALSFQDGLHPSPTISETISLIKEDLDIKYYVSKGYTKAEAFAKVKGVSLEIAKMIYE